MSINNILRQHVERSLETHNKYKHLSSDGFTFTDDFGDIEEVMKEDATAHKEYTPEPYLQFVDEKTEPTFNFEDDFGDMATLAATATESQVGGDHYTKQGIQPLEATFANFSYEGIQAAIYTKVNKYLTRDKGTHRQDITKAIHVLQMQLEFYDRFNAVDTLAPRHTNQPIEGNK